MVREEGASAFSYSSFPLHRCVVDVTEIRIAERGVSHRKVWIGLDRSAEQSFRLLELSLMPECHAISVLFKGG